MIDVLGLVVIFGAITYMKVDSGNFSISDAARKIDRKGKERGLLRAFLIHSAKYVLIVAVLFFLLFLRFH